ncbi:hypothetical protein DNL40_11615 [Xylanimonas oleitrophica]|uniref:Acetone carboxylase n=1 Tax=Xylanimonas oleitrophica TaxID=2607479 RepID=A0A2W5WP61_9MICO|nr:hypothetical protein [Xylanimonas oleitrophica]PZR52523.1 hypothetical protein DNL40_11615 [Xylanimonas oleitrophica]
MDLLGTADAVAEGELLCSAKGCRAEAAWGLLWNNPKIHTPERRKVWLACDEHREHLEQFLSRRDFWKQTVPVDALDRFSPEARP